MAVTLTQICDGIETTLTSTVGIRTTATFSELTEGVSSLNCPLLEVYPQSGSCDPHGRTDRTTMNAGVQQSIITVHVDLYARQRSNLGEDMAQTMSMVDSIIDILQEQEKPPFFGVAAIKSFSWSWRKAVHNRAGADYVGARFTLLLRIF